MEQGQIDFLTPTFAHTHTYILHHCIKPTFDVSRTSDLQIHPRKLLETLLRWHLTESVSDIRSSERNLVQHYPKLPDTLHPNSESKMVMYSPRTILSSPVVPPHATSSDTCRYKRLVKKTIPLVRHSSSYVATQIELPVVDITCNYNSCRYKNFEESLRRRYGANYPPGEVVLNYIQLSTPDSRTGMADGGSDDLLDVFEVDDVGTYSSSVSTKLETEYLNLLDHFVSRQRGRALTAGKFTETSLSDERNLEMSPHTVAWSQSTLKGSVTQEKESGSSGNQRSLKGTKYV